MNVNEKKQALDLQATIAAQTKTIERLADALEFALAYGDVDNDNAEELKEWHEYVSRNYPDGVSKTKANARALLAEIRGRKE